MPKKELTIDMPNIHFYIKPKIQSLLDIGWIVFAIGLPAIKVAAMRYDFHQSLLTKCMFCSAGFP